MATLSLMAARELAGNVLRAAGVADPNAEAVMRALVAAEADGLASHGLVRLPMYADQVKVGKVDGQAVPVVTEAAPGAGKGGAKDGFAVPALTMGLARAAGSGRSSGTVADAVGDSRQPGAGAE